MLTGQMFNLKTHDEYSHGFNMGMEIYTQHSKL